MPGGARLRCLLLFTQSSGLARAGSSVPTAVNLQPFNQSFDLHNLPSVLVPQSNPSFNLCEGVFRYRLILDVHHGDLSRSRGLLCSSCAPLVRFLTRIFPASAE